MPLKYLLFLLSIVTRASSKCKKCFTSDFLWGTATSAYQIEGGWDADGKGENVWDWYTHSYPEKITDKSNGDVACDSYNKYEEDVQLLKDLGVQTYRFSLSWSRILPEGTINKVNQAGVDYYLNLLQALIANNIEPIVTIYHWDLPIKLHQLGGWTNPEMANFFADYSNLCYQLFGSHVKYWITLNEPITQCIYGYGLATHAPGYSQSGTLSYLCAYTKLLAHAKSYRIYNETYKSAYGGKVGITLVSLWYHGATDSDADKVAASNGFQWAFGLFAHPIFKGNWPEVIRTRIDTLSVAQGFNRSRLPALTQDEISLINGTQDFLGFNYYTTVLASPIDNLAEIENTTVSYAVDRNVATSFNFSWPQAASAWIFEHPQGLREMLKMVSDLYDSPSILITENGWSDHVNNLNDTDRIRYINGHLCNVFKARYIDGVNVIGYSHWSLMDNFEWAEGYTEGFGLVSVDFSSSNRTRTPKLSYYHYQTIAKSNCLETCSILND